MGLIKRELHFKCSRREKQQQQRQITMRRETGTVQNRVKCLNHWKNKEEKNR